jgi:hypothetical protein
MALFKYSVKQINMRMERAGTSFCPSKGHLDLDVYLMADETVKLLNKTT